MDPRWTPIPRIRAYDDPAAGAGIVITADHGAGLLIQTLRFTLTTDATLVARAVFAEVTDGNVVYVRFPGARATSENITRQFATFQGATSNDLGTGADLLNWPQEGLFLPQGHTLTVTAVNLQPADQFADIGSSQIEFPTGPHFRLWPFPHYYTEEAE